MGLGPARRASRSAFSRRRRPRRRSGTAARSASRPPGPRRRSAGRRGRGTSAAIVSQLAGARQPGGQAHREPDGVERADRLEHVVEEPAAVPRPQPPLGPREDEDARRDEPNASTNRPTARWMVSSGTRPPPERRHLAGRGSRDQASSPMRATVVVLMPPGRRAGRAADQHQQDRQEVRALGRLRA